MHSMTIGSISLAAPTVFAPLAGISNLPLRLLAKEAGAGLVCSEMVSTNGLVYGAAKTHQLMASNYAEKPLCIQIFGSDPQIVAEGARLAVNAGADIIDLNFGCAVRKILKSGSGAALMKDIDRAEKILKAVRQAIAIPVTLKMRAGWDASGKEAFRLAQIAQDCGIDALTLHPRTARQGFSGHADWSLIARLKKTVAIPLIGNGDIGSAEDAMAMFSQTGCDGVMVGRAAIGNPFIFAQIQDRLNGRAPLVITPVQRFAVMRRYLTTSVAHLGETRACLMMRSRLNWFAKGMPHAGHFRKSAALIASSAQALALIDAFEASLSLNELDWDNLGLPPAGICDKKNSQ
jgi:tRNA-dihydrouridine synthase B